MTRRLQWVTLPDYQDHEISSAGQIRHARSKQVLNTSVNQGGLRYAHVRNTTLGKTENKAVGTLVATAFCEGQSENTNTVLHLDGDPDNCSAANPMWVTRFHAIAYHKEILDPENQRRQRIVETLSGRRYRTLQDAALKTGCLPSAISYAVRYNDAQAVDEHTNFVHRVYPGGLIFKSQ